MLFCTSIVDGPPLQPRKITAALYGWVAPGALWLTRAKHWWHDMGKLIEEFLVPAEGENAEGAESQVRAHEFLFDADKDHQ